MGRLFWKFFLSILLAQLAATIGVGGTLWLRNQAGLGGGKPPLDTGPPAEAMIDAAAATLKHGGNAALRELMADLKCTPLFVLDASGNDLLGRELSPRLRREVASDLAGEGPRHAVRTLTATNGQRYLAFVSRRWRDSEPIGAAAADGNPLPPMFGHHIRRRTAFIAATLASLLSAALLAWSFSRPIRALRSAFEAASAGDLAPRFQGTGCARGDDLSNLGRDFDRMSARLRALMDGQRRLLHDVSHELRSPLARLQAAIGLAHQQPDKTAASLARIERESVRMDKLVGELLTLSRLNASPAMPVREAVEIAEMVAQIADDASFEAGPGTRIEVWGASQAVVTGDPDLLWRAIENVVRNAVKHGGGAAEIGLRAGASVVHIDVLDRGPGVPEADLPSIFEPFFRAHPAYNNIDGHGLGLAVAQRVAQTHGGAIAAANREGGGLRVTVSLPLSAISVRTSSARARAGIAAR
jgi:two-component system OmpR family sensor kinase